MIIMYHRGREGFGCHMNEPGRMNSNRNSRENSTDDAEENTTE